MLGSNQAILLGLSRGIADDGSDRGVWGGGDLNSTNTNVIQYVTISTEGNAKDFGDLTQTRAGVAGSSNGANDRGVFFGGGGQEFQYNTMDYITISSKGDAVDFGDLVYARSMSTAGTSNGINDRGLTLGGWTQPSLFTYNTYNYIEYFTISTTGNAIDLADLNSTSREAPATSNTTNERAILFGGYQTGFTQQNNIQYKTINTSSNALSFGVLSTTKVRSAAVSNGTNERALCAGGNDSTITNVIEYITISSTGNSVDFGDLLAANQYNMGVDNKENERGLIGGGNTGVTSDSISYVTINTLGNATDFGDLTGTLVLGGTVSNV